MVCQVATEFYSLGIDKLVSHPMSVQAFEQAGNVYVYVRDMTIMGDISVSQRDLYISGSVINGFENRYVFMISPDGELTLKHSASLHSCEG